MRDENGFKMHVQSESHVRQMVVVGENSSKFIQDYSSQFQRDFLQLLKTSHGEKKVNANHFYQEYIANKSHVHMNATRWTTLSEFVKMLGREGVCRVEEGDHGLEVAWIDNSPEALRRQDAIRKKERQDKGDEEREQRMIREQVDRARRNARVEPDITDDGPRALDKEGAGKIKLEFGARAAAAPKAPSPDQIKMPEEQGHNLAPRASLDGTDPIDEGAKTNEALDERSSEHGADPVPSAKVGLNVAGLAKKPKNIFATVKKNPLASHKQHAKRIPQRPMSEAERIMKHELEQKAAREQNGPPRKRHKA